jgi:glycosyltransferase involved in cell wall biosynthesis
LKKVVIFQPRLLHYRKSLFEQLRAACAERDIELHLVHGQASRRESAKNDEATLSWAKKVHNHFWEVGERDIVWQPFPTALQNADLVVVMQENRILSNYPLLLGRVCSPRKVAYWGHGKNFQSDAPTGLREKWKNFLLKHVDWWFAYTEMTVEILRRAGYPEKRITCLENSIDNEGFQNDLSAISPDRLTQLREDLGANTGSRVGLFCGSLYPDKRVDYMMAAADRIHAELPGFRLVVIGDGPSAPDIRAAAETRKWVKYVGVCKGIEKAAYFRLADVVFNPGAVGLHVLDAFCAGLPIATTLEARHGPELAYLKNGHNGIIANGDAKNYSKKIIDLLSDPSEYTHLCTGAREGAKRYTLQNMVNRFVEGIEESIAK